MKVNCFWTSLYISYTRERTSTVYIEVLCIGQVRLSWVQVEIKLSLLWLCQNTLHRVIWVSRSMSALAMFFTRFRALSTAWLSRFRIVPWSQNWRAVLLTVCIVRQFLRGLKRTDISKTEVESCYRRSKTFLSFFCRDMRDFIIWGERNLNGGWFHKKETGEHRHEEKISWQMILNQLRKQFTILEFEFAPCMKLSYLYATN